MGEATEKGKGGKQTGLCKASTAPSQLFCPDPNVQQTDFIRSPRGGEALGERFKPAKLP